MKKTSTTFAGCNIPVIIILLWVYSSSFCLNASVGKPFSQRLRSEVSIFSTFSDQSHQPFWLTSNRRGMFKDDGHNALGLFSARFLEKGNRLWDISGGLDILAKATPEAEFYLHQAYLEAQLGPFHLLLGSKEITLGHTFEPLSSGSAAQSNNARPIPQVAVSIPEYFSVPYTAGWLEFKGHIAHGWLRDNRYAKNARYHDKSFYVQTGTNSGFKLYAGVVHIALWGGETEAYGKLPSGLKDFMKVLVAKGVETNAPANEVNALGFHSGIYDGGIKASIGNRSYHLYYQHIFTDGSGMRLRNLGDGLFGLGIENQSSEKWLNGIVYEFLNTKNQTSPGLSDRINGDWPLFCDQPNCGYRYGGRDNYYNNSIYRSGLSYYGLSMGSPLFLTKNQLNKVDTNINTYSPMYFVSTRNLAHHMGFMGSITETISYRILATYVQYHGTYAGRNLGTYWGSLDPEMNPEDYFFNPFQNQWYLLLETSWKIPFWENLNLMTAISADTGTMFNSTGFLLGIQWVISSSK